MVYREAAVIRPMAVAKMGRMQIRCIPMLILLLRGQNVLRGSAMHAKTNADGPSRSHRRTCGTEPVHVSLARAPRRPYVERDLRLKLESARSLAILVLDDHAGEQERRRREWTETRL